MNYFIRRAFKPKWKHSGYARFIDNTEQFKKLIPMGRYGSSINEIATVVSFLASEGGAYITGQNIRVDGGISRSV